MKRENGTKPLDLNDRARGASMAPIDDGEASIADEGLETVIDDQGTEPFEAVEILKQLLETEFDTSEEKLALALGRSSNEISEWLSGGAIVDSDALNKLRALADQRGVEIE